MATFMSCWGLEVSAWPNKQVCNVTLQTYLLGQALTFFLCLCDFYPFCSDQSLSINKQLQSSRLLMRRELTNVFSFQTYTYSHRLFKYFGHCTILITSREMSGPKSGETPQNFGARPKRLGVAEVAQVIINPWKHLRELLSCHDCIVLYLFCTCAFIFQLCLQASSVQLLSL